MNREILVWFALFVASLVLQTVVIPVIAVGGVMPDLCIIVLFAFAIKWGMMPGIWVGFFFGLSQDLYSPSIIGQNALAATIIGLFIGLFNERVMRTGPLAKVVVLLVAIIIHDAVFNVVTLLSGDGGAGFLFTTLLVKTLPRALYTVAAGLALFAVAAFGRKPSFRE